MGLVIAIPLGALVQQLAPQLKFSIRLTAALDAG
jgi:hypothetical protein